MMILKKETQGIYSYLVYEIEKEDMIDEFSLGMISNNRISGLLPLVFTQMDDKRYLKYNISSKVPASEFFAGIVNKKRLLGVLGSIAEAIISTDEYMLDEKAIILDLDYIYVDVSSNQAELVYLPVLGENVEKKTANNFIKEIMFSNQFDQGENCDYVAQLMNFLNASSSFNIYSFKQLVNDLQVTKTENNKQNQPPVTNSKKQDVTVSTPANNFVTNDNKVKEPPKEKTIKENISIPEEKAVGHITDVKPKSNQHVPEMSIPKTEEEDKTNKEISMFHLLMHYSKENKELYKNQKNKKEKNVKKERSVDKKIKQNTQTSFSVPGNNYSVPGMDNIPVQKEIAQTPQTKQQNVQDISHSTVERAAIVQPRSSYTGVSADFGETTILGGGMVAGETTVLSVQQSQPKQVVPYLIRLKNNEKILINKPRYRIGKEKSYVDYFIGDNAAISRSHADIIVKDNSCAIIDMNSTNHTFVNDEMIQSGMEINLNDSDKVRLGNEEFIFKLN